MYTYIYREVRGIPTWESSKPHLSSGLNPSLLSPLGAVFQNNEMDLCYHHVPLRATLKESSVGEIPMVWYVHAQLWELDNTPGAPYSSGLVRLFRPMLHTSP